MNVPDITYRKKGGFIHFYAETQAGQSVWNMLATKSDGSGVFFASHGEAIIRQIRAAGYSVRKAETESLSENDICAELFS